MLEHSTLLVNAWSQADGVARWIRQITTVQRETLGFVEIGGDRRGSWLSWLRQSRLDVWEAPDGSHLMCLTRAWSLLRSWELYDSEDRHIGGLYTKTIVTSDHENIGSLVPKTKCIVGPDGKVLAGYDIKADSSFELTFAPEATVNPFVRMLLLGSLLTLNPTPAYHSRLGWGGR